ncbi:MAG: hypothetical protein EA361_03440 [Bacteroidetes bacterium]|nr:MAG: hypothetical protein EA361_03440 [Bacteroidota bacterium]
MAAKAIIRVKSNVFFIFCNFGYSKLSNERVGSLWNWLRTCLKENAFPTLKVVKIYFFFKNNPLQLLKSFFLWEKEG